MIARQEQIGPAHRELAAIEADLLAETGARAVVWCGRAATALFWAYHLAHARRADVDQPEIIMPSMMCTTAAFSAELAGMTPRFADIDPQTGLITLASIQERLTPQTIAVVVVHLYGSAADAQAIQQWGAERGIAVIEDVAQAQGARLPSGAMVGSAGDMAVYSFNSTKILESGGGALTVKADYADGLEDVLRRHPLPPPAPTAQLTELAHSYRNVHHGLVAALRADALTPPTLATSFAALRPTYYPLYLRPTPPIDALIRDWPTLRQRLMERYEKAALYASALAGGPWHLLDGWQASGVCWRFSLLLDDGPSLVTISESLRKDGFHVSNLYWPPSHFFRPDDPTPHAEAFARRIMNLWVNEQVDRARILTACERLWHYADSLQKRG